MRRNERGEVEIIVAILFVVFFVSMLFISFKSSNEVVSGIAYNVSNDSFISGNTKFSVRASEDTYITEENQSSYCLPPGSPYKDLVNKAAEDKRVKIIVNAEKYFTIKAPWVCYPNVTVNEVK